MKQSMVWVIALAGTITIGSAALAESSPEITEEAVFFDNGEVTIAGVVMSPATEGPHPAIVLIDGSGQTDRHNMRDFSLAFTQAGFVTLAYDKRGVGESTGDTDAWYYFSIDDLAADAAAGAEFLAARDDVAKNRIGLFGMSQGGWVTPRAATLTEVVSFMILRSASVTTIGEDRLFERAARLTGEGFTPEEVEESRAMQVIYQQYIRTGEGFGEFEKAWQENENKPWFSSVFRSDAFLDPEHRYHQWYATVQEFDPLPYLSELEIPALWLFGDPQLDGLTPVAASVEALDTLQQQGKEYTIRVFPGTDHNIMPIDEPEAFPPYVEPLMQWLGQF